MSYQSESKDECISDANLMAGILTTIGLCLIIFFIGTYLQELDHRVSSLEKRFGHLVVTDSGEVRSE